MTNPTGDALQARDGYSEETPEGGIIRLTWTVEGYALWYHGECVWTQQPRPQPTPEPFGYAVIMDLTRKLANFARVGDMQSVHKLNDLMRELEAIYPEATALIEERYGSRS